MTRRFWPSDRSRPSNHGLVKSRTPKTPISSAPPSHSLPGFQPNFPLKPGFHSTRPTQSSRSISPSTPSSARRPRSLIKKLTLDCATPKDKRTGVSANKIIVATRSTPVVILPTSFHSLATTPARSVRTPRPTNRDTQSRSLGDPVAVASESAPNSSIPWMTMSPIPKKVRFSSTSPLLTSIPNQSTPRPMRGDNSEVNRNSKDNASLFEPIIFTVHPTHSRYAYDRSPIVVDKVFNRSLDLPPRSRSDAAECGRWLQQSQLPRVESIICSSMGSDICDRPDATSPVHSSQIHDDQRRSDISDSRDGSSSAHFSHVNADLRGISLPLLLAYQPGCYGAHMSPQQTDGWENHPKRAEVWEVPQSADSWPSPPAPCRTTLEPLSSDCAANPAFFQVIADCVENSNTREGTGFDQVTNGQDDAEREDDRPSELRGFGDWASHDAFGTCDVLGGF